MDLIVRTWLYLHYLLHVFDKEISIFFKIYEDFFVNIFYKTIFTKRQYIHLKFFDKNIPIIYIICATFFLGLFDKTKSMLDI